MATKTKEPVYTPEELAYADHVCRRVALSRRLEDLILEVVQSDLDANEIHQIIGSAGLIAHPIVVQNLLARREALRVQ
ncbi:MAG: hypothetical protein WA734_00275 [Candidatus Acidiferrales bacterium]